jgi:dTDP-4-amino-4,6-dideoxygalactose transaminase
MEDPPRMEVSGRRATPWIEEYRQIPRGCTVARIEKGGTATSHMSTVFTFYPTKNLAAFGDAEPVVTTTTKIAKRVRVLRNYGSRSQYHNKVKWINSKVNSIQASFPPAAEELANTVLSISINPH